MSALVPLVASADDRPDLSGVYGNYGPPGGGARNVELPLTDSARERVEEVEYILEGTGETSGGWCLGSGMPGSMMGSGAYPMEIIQRPEQITIIYEAHNELRRIYLADHKKIPPEERFPDRNGYSEGRWEGGTLVVETSDLKEQVDGRYPHSANARIIERYRQTSGSEGEDVLVADVTLIDPDFYTREVNLEKRWERDPEGRMLPYECNEPVWNERLEELREEKLGASR